MAKSSKGKGFSWMPLYVVVLLLVVGGGIWVTPEWKDRFTQYIENSDILTLESKVTPQSVMEAQRAELIGNASKRTYLEPILRYYPYLMLDVKYTEDQKSREGLLLWGLNDGEIVLNTQTWETTHGFKDCIEGDACRSDFKLLLALAQKQGSQSIEELQKSLHIERDTLDHWVDNAKKKHLIIQKGNQVTLHFENPKILTTPATRLKQNLVSKSLSNSIRVAKNYTRNQIVKIAQAAFGPDFKIRSEQVIYLPVYSLTVLNPDESSYTSDWNAVTGNRMTTSF